MKIFGIEACAEGSYWEYDVNCPPGWYGSGCYDVEVECYQEVFFKVAAETLDDALQMILDQFKNCHGDYANSIDSVFYNTASVTEEDDEEGGDSEIFDYEISEPVGRPDAPKEYNAEIIGVRKPKIKRDESK